MEIYDIYRDVIDDDLSKKQKERLLSDCIKHIINEESIYIKDILSYVNNNDIQDKSIYDDIYTSFDFDVTQKSGVYFSQRNRDNLTIRMIVFDIIINHFGVDYLLYKIFYNNYVENYIVALFISMGLENDDLTNVLFDRLNSIHILGNSSTIDNLINFHNKSVANIPYHVISNVIRLREIYYSYKGVTINTKMLINLLNNPLFDKFTNNEYFKLYNRLGSWSNILDYEKTMNTKLDIFQYASIMVKYNRPTEIIVDEFFNRLLKYSHVNDALDKIFSKLTDKYALILKFYNIIDEHRSNLISPNLINIIYKHFHCYANFYSVGFFDNESLSNVFILNGLLEETVIKHETRSTFIYSSTKRYSTSSRGAIEFVDNFRLNTRQLKIDDILKKGVK